MAPKNLYPSASLDTISSELIYTQARLASDPNAEDLAPTIDPLLSEVTETGAGQQSTWIAETRAQAQCDFLNAQLDDLVVEFADTLLFTVKDRTSTRVTHYLRQAPYAIVRLGLASELEVVREWPESLKNETDEALKAFAPKFTDMIAKGDAAVSALGKAENARSEFRMRSIELLVEKLNGERMKLHTQLAGRANEKNLGKYWADGFFKSTTKRRRTKDEVETPEPS